MRWGREKYGMVEYGLKVTGSDRVGLGKRWVNDRM